MLAPVLDQLKAGTYSVYISLPSEYVIRASLMQTTPVSWDQGLTIFLDNHHENDAEEHRCK